MSEKILYGDIGDVLPVEEDITDEEIFADGLPARLDSTAGNDTLTGTTGSDTFIYKGGNDTITNYSGEDTVSIASGKVTGYSFNDDGDLIFKVGNGSITLKYMQGRAITVKDSTGTSTKIYGTDYSGHDAIKNMVKAWSETLLANGSTIKLDESVRLSSHFNSIQEVIDQMIADRKSCADGDTFLRKYCGIVMDNDDSGGVIGWDAGGLSMISENDIVGETLSTLQHLPDYKKSSVTTSQGVTVNISSTGGSSLTADAKKVLDGLYSWWAEESFGLIEDSFGLKFEEGTEVTFSLVPKGSYWGVTTGNDVKINMNSTWFNGTNDYNGNGVDMTIAHEFTHVAQNLFLGHFPQFLHEGFADLAPGADDRSNKRSYIISVANNADSLASYLDLNKGGTGTAAYYATGFMFYRYFMRQASINYDSTKKYAWSDKANITGTSAAEFLTASGNSSTITAGAGNDTITSYGDYMKVFGGDDADRIYNAGNSATIDGGDGNDTITNKGANVSIGTGAGNDSLGNDTDGTNAKIFMGAGNDSVFNSAEGVTIDGGADVDKIFNYGAKTSIFGGAGEDTVQNYSAGNSVTIDGGAGKDYVWNYGGKVSMSGGADGDYLQNYASGNDVTISGGDGADTVFNSGSEVSISGGADNDYIDNDAANVTIGGGAGSNTVYNSGKYVTFVYEGGNDYISGADATSTLKITKSFTSVASGSNLILNVSDGGEITLVGAKGKDISVDDGKNNKSWRLDGTTAIYGTATSSLITISGVQSVDGIQLSGRQVTLPKSALGTSTVTIKDGYTLALADDVPVSEETAPTLTINGNKTSATLNQTFTAGYTLSTDKRTITYSAVSTGNKLGTISGLMKNFSVSDITVDTANKKLVVSKNALGTSKVSVGKTDTYTLALASGTTATTNDPEWSTKNNAAYYTQTTEAGYTLANDGRSITCSSKPKTTTLATVSGLKKGVTTDDFYTSGSTIYLKESALSTSKVSVKGDFTLQLADGIPTVGSVTSANWTIKGANATYKGNIGDYYTTAANGKSVAYTKAKTNATLATIGGLNTNTKTTDISISGKTITLAANALNADAKKKTVVKGDYTLAIDDSLKTATQKNIWTNSGTTATYSAGTTGYFTLASDNKTISYSAAKAGTTPIITLTNLNNKTIVPNADGTITGITLDESAKTVTLSNAVLNKKVVDITGNYTLALGSDVTEKSTVSKAEWTHKGTADTLAKTTSKGYSLASDTKITYASKVISTVLATVKGTAKALTDSNYSAATNTVSLTNSDLATNHKVTVSGTTKFNFASDFSKATITGSALADTLAVGGDSILITAGKGDDSISVTGSNVSINAGAGNDYVDMGSGSNLFLYAAGEGNDTIGGFSANDTIKVTKGTVTTAKSGNDVILTVTQGNIKGTITLTDAANQSFSVYNSKNVSIASYAASSADVISENYFDESPQLGEILGASYDAISTDEFGTSYDATQLAKQTVVYGAKK